MIDGQLVAEQVAPVRSLAANQWIAAPELLGLEMLAAFVMPNHPSIGGLLAEAAELLQQRTCSPSMPGYQAGPHRVDQVVRAIYEAAQARQIRFVTAPASWTDVGQQVRTPGEVLADRLGTCLDTTLMLAAALEQAGLRPLLFVVHGHAFLGYWRDEHGRPGPAQTEVADIVNLIDLDLIRLVETTTITVSDPPWSFDASHRPPYMAFLQGDLSAVHGVVDIAQCRLDRIVPLSAQVRGVDGSVQVFTYLQANGRTGSGQPAAGPAEQPAGGTAAATPPWIEQWKNRLLDLSLRNKLINFHRRGSIGLCVPDGLFGAIEDRVRQSAGVTLLGSDQVSSVAGERGVQFGRDLPADQLAELFTTRGSLFTDVSTASYDARLRAMAYKARTVIEETGANNLYLALGSLLWKVDDRELRSPLVLVPIRLTSRARQQAYRIELDESGASTPNFCLLEKLRQVHGLQIPGLAQPAEDAFGIDLDGALTAMRVALAEAGLPFRVEASAEVAMLQFAKYRLWMDLADHWPALVGNPLVNHLVHTPFDPFTDQIGAAEQLDLDELAASCPIPADASQTAAIGEATPAGRSCWRVRRGPENRRPSELLDGLPGEPSAGTARTAVLHAVEAEGPLELDRLIRLVAAGFGLHRVLTARQAAILAQLPSGLTRDPAAPEFAWPASLDPLTWQGFRRTPGGVERPLEQISPVISAMRWSRCAVPRPG